MLGRSVKHDKEAKVLSISQKVYLENVRQRFGMYDCKPVFSQMKPGKKYYKLPDDQDPVDIQRYQAAIGSLTNASLATRPDISYAEGVLGLFMTLNALGIGQEL